MNAHDRANALRHALAAIPDEEAPNPTAIADALARLDEAQCRAFDAVTSLHDLVSRESEAWNVTLSLVGK